MHFGRCEADVNTRHLGFSTEAELRVGDFGHTGLEHAVASQDDELNGGDETQIRLLDWRKGQKSEYLAALILDEEGYTDIDPSHPLGGPDGGRDGHCTKNSEPWIWAVYFPRGQQDLKTISDKLKSDIEVACKHSPRGVAFVTNQELKMAERKKLCALGGDLPIDLIHLYRVATILDRPHMAQIRYEYLRIGASRPPVRAVAEVVGAARVFANDEDLFELHVKRREAEIREVSDAAWARVKAEEDERARAAEVEAIRAAREAMGKSTPTTLAGALANSLQNPVAGIDFLAILPKLDSPMIGGRYRALEKPKPPKPLSDDEIAAEVATYRDGLEARWESCNEYLAAVVWPGLKFTIRNTEGFLNNVQMILTFHGAKGLDFQDIESFEPRKLDDPQWTEPIDPYSPTSVLRAVAPLTASSLKDYPVWWENDENGDLIVKITLPQLRPHEVWSSRDDDIVLMLRDVELDSVEVTYTITASEHHDRLDGEPFTVPVERIDSFDSVREALDA